MKNNEDMPAGSDARSSLSHDSSSPVRPGTLVTRRQFVVYTSAALAALSALAGCNSQPSQSFSVRSSDAAEPLEASDREATPADMGPPRHLARLAVIGDTHVTSSFQPGVTHTRAAFQALTQFDPAPDAIVINGDITDHGLHEEYDLITQLAAEAGLQFPESFVTVMGNHEQRGPTGENTPETYQEHRDVFLQRCGLEWIYYDLEVKDQHIIVLGPDVDPIGWWSFKLSNEQLVWLDGKLAEDAAQNRRSFVFLHQPANDTVIYSYEGEIVHDSLESSAELLEVLRKYPDAILMTGHSHSPNDFSRPDPNGPLFVANSAVAYLRLDPHDSSIDNMNMSRGLLIDVFTDRTEFLSWDYALGTEAETGGYSLPHTEAAR